MKPASRIASLVAILGSALSLAGCQGGAHSTLGDGGILRASSEATSFFGGAALARFEPRLAIGGIYTTIGEPRNLIAGARIDQFCEKDTDAYKPIAEEPGALAATFKEKITGARLLDIGSITFPGLNFSAKVSADRLASYEFADVTKRQLARDEVQSAEIKSAIGEDCWSFIKQYKAQNRDVFILVEAEHVAASQVDLMRSSGGSAGASIELGKWHFGPKGELSAKIERTITTGPVFIEVRGDLL